MAITADPPLGPLTTLFTPASGCLETVTSVTPIADSIDGPLWVGAIANTIDPKCYPPSYRTDYVFSPGICPSGWTSACSPQAGGQSQVFPPSVTAAQCCPSGFSCLTVNNTHDYAYCVSMPPNSAISVWAIATGGASSTVTNLPTIATIRAKPIFVAYQTTDTLIANTTPSLSPSPTSSTSVASTKTPSGSSGLSQSAKIAIGVAVPVVTIFAAFVLGILVILYRHSNRTLKTVPVGHNTGLWNSMSPPMQNHEMPSEREAS